VRILAREQRRAGRAAEREGDEAVVEGDPFVPDQAADGREHGHLGERLVVGLEDEDVPARPCGDRMRACLSIARPMSYRPGSAASRHAEDRSETAGLARILLLTAHELTRDPRARRAAAAAMALGLDVLGVCGAGEPPVPLQGVEVTRVGSGGVGARLRRAGLGGMRPSRPLVRELRGLYRIGRLARANLGLARAAVRTGPVDVVHANDFDTLPAGWLVARRRRARLVYDAHELYADQEPEAPRLYRALVRAAERLLARRADAVVTVSDPIAEELHRTLRLRRIPLVVLNCPPRTEVKEAPAADGRVRAIYQGAMGPGRRLEDLLSAAASAEPVHLTIRLANADLEALRAEVLEQGLGQRVEVVEPVEPDRLVEALAEFHVGLVINRPLTRNDELVFPNKLFEYLMAGLAVVVPRLPGMAPLVEGEGLGLTYEPGRPDALAAALTQLAGDRGRLEGMRRRARELALERYNAEEQRHGLEAAWGLA
jgi:glycosyltransferase involved in cell wall biosynthesis